MLKELAILFTLDHERIKVLVANQLEQISNFPLETTSWPRSVIISVPAPGKEFGLKDFHSYSTSNGENRFLPFESTARLHDGPTTEPPVCAMRLAECLLPGRAQGQLHRNLCSCDFLRRLWRTHRNADWNCTQVTTSEIAVKYSLFNQARARKPSVCARIEALPNNWACKSADNYFCCWPNQLFGAHLDSVAHRLAVTDTRSYARPVSSD